MPFFTGINNQSPQPRGRCSILVKWDKTEASSFSSKQVYSNWNNTCELTFMARVCKTKSLLISSSQNWIFKRQAASLARECPCAFCVICVSTVQGIELFLHIYFFYYAYNITLNIDNDYIDIKLIKTLYMICTNNDIIYYFTVAARNC